MNNQKVIEEIKNKIKELTDLLKEFEMNNNIEVSYQKDIEVSNKNEENNKIIDKVTQPVKFNQSQRMMLIPNNILKLLQTNLLKNINNSKQSNEISKKTNEKPNQINIKGARSFDLPTNKFNLLRGKFLNNQDMNEMLKEKDLIQSARTI